MMAAQIKPASLRSKLNTEKTFSSTSRSQRHIIQATRCQYSNTGTPSFLQRAAVTVGACALAFQMTAVQPALAEDSIEPVYFGNGCFWGRQHDFVQAEQDLGRQMGDISAVVGYAGGAVPFKDPANQKVCYYYTPEKDNVYEPLGHAEVVQVELRGADKKQEFKRMADTYFSQFRRLPNGKMLRQDPQDSGPGYRNVIGIPGGVNSDLFTVLKDANVNNMELREGNGGRFSPDGKPLEDDVLNVVWVVDSQKLPFYQAEKYHQYHNGLGYKFPDSYTKEMKQAAIEAGQVKETGCPEFFFLGS
jgi:peptide methionine sulfoxide reductase MsrA